MGLINEIESRQKKNETYLGNFEPWVLFWVEKLD